MEGEGLRDLMKIVSSKTILQLEMSYVLVFQPFSLPEPALLAVIWEDVSVQVIGLDQGDAP